MRYLYKDSRINHISEYNKIFRSLEEKGIISLIDKELKENEKNKRTNNWEHENINCCVDTDTRTEKRLCRCLYFYQSEKKKCNKCALYNSEKEEIKKYFCKLINNATVVDYEIPVSDCSDDGIGEIDLLIDYKGDYYCTEVKPCWNNETILRMILEILTYTKMMEKNIKLYKEKYSYTKDFRKAILFMEDSKQEKLWDEQNKGIVNNVIAEMKDFILKNNITVFCLKQENNQYSLVKIQ